MRILPKILACAILAGAAITLPASAHKASDSYLHLDPTQNGIAVSWEVALRDLDAVMDLDANHDGKLRWGEIEDRRADIEDTLTRSLLLVGGDRQPCTMAAHDFGYIAHGDGGYVVVEWQAGCAQNRITAIRSTLFQRIDPSHRVLVATGAIPLALAPGERRETDLRAAPVIAAAPGVSVPAPSMTMTMTNADNDEHGVPAFIREGVMHIFTGPDHILFLLSLLLPAVLIRKDAGKGAGIGGWQPQVSLRSVLATVAWTATAFTLSHSITLACAVQGIFRPPSSIIEPLIALTVLLSAVNNVWPLWKLSSVATAFLFGFIHGFGFADALVPLQLAPRVLAGALFGFNVGVEIGQLAIITAFCLVAFPLRAWRGYVPWMMRGGSLVTAGIAAIWITERLFGIQVFPGRI
jgi:hypothetical protein